MSATDDQPSPASPLRAEVAAAYLDLAGQIEQLSNAEWESPSLCEGWRTREVLAHLTMPLRLDVPTFMAELEEDRGDFHAMSDRIAKRDASALSDVELVAALRDPALHDWEPPGGGFEGAFVHVMVHGLDVTIPLGREDHIPDSRIKWALEVIGSPDTFKHFGTDLEGIRLEASDMEWSLGSGGAVVSGPSRVLAVVLCGRRVPAGLLDGDGVARFELSER
jgi:uncharacterized protein (TIGR03083 family)